MRKSFVLLTLALAAFAVRAQDHGQERKTAPAMSQSAMAQVEQAWQAYLQRATAALGRSDDARDLAFAAMLTFSQTRPDPSQPQPPEAMRWRQAALDRAGQDVLAYQLVLASRPAPASGQGDLAARRWQALEPDNLAPVMYAQLDAEPLLAAARTRSYTDLHWYDSLRWMQAALLRHPPTAQELDIFSAGHDLSFEEVAATEVLGIWSAFVLPGYAPLARACRSDAFYETATRRTDCRHVAQVLTAEPSTVLEHAVGLALQRQLADTDAERERVQRERARLDWMLRTAASLSLQLGPAQMLRQLSGPPPIRTEQQWLERQLRQAGLPLSPPETPAAP